MLSELKFVSVSPNLLQFFVYISRVFRCRQLGIMQGTGSSSQFQPKGITVRVLSKFRSSVLHLEFLSWLCCARVPRVSSTAIHFAAVIPTVPSHQYCHTCSESVARGSSANSARFLQRFILARPLSIFEIICSSIYKFCCPHSCSF